MRSLFNGQLSRFVLFVNPISVRMLLFGRLFCSDFGLLLGLLLSIEDGLVVIRHNEKVYFSIYNNSLESSE